MHQRSVLACDMSAILLTLGSWRCVASIYLVLPGDQAAHNNPLGMLLLAGSACATHFMPFCRSRGKLTNT